MIRKELIVVALIVVFSINVSAGMNAKCDGNTLISYDKNNDIVKQDCSILHTGAGMVYRGACKTYTGGADCWRVSGDVTTAYREAIRGVANKSDGDPWKGTYEPVTTTTTLMSSISSLSCPVCQVCDVCDCSSYKNVISALNSTIDFYKGNADAYKAASDSKVDKATYMSALDDKDKVIQISAESNVRCMKDKADVESWNATYMIIAGVCVFIVVLVIYIWVKYEFYGGVKFDDAFSDSKSVKPKKKQ